MNILVTGSNGQLGSELKVVSKIEERHTFFFTDVDELDICDLQLVKNYLAKFKIDVIINCAAYTAVDKAENDIGTARDLNAKSVSNLVTACEELNCKLVHISTDYVFNGEYFKPISENEQANPIGIYGVTKREGEEFLFNSSIEGLVIRTSWLYSSFGSNFVKTMLRLGKERNQLSVIFDQIGTPTYARDLVRVILQILNSETRLNVNGKVYHYSNEGVASWYDFALAIMELGKVKCVVIPIETTEYPTPAQRPFYSLMNKSKIKKDFLIEIPHWRRSLQDCIKLIQA